MKQKPPKRTMKDVAKRIKEMEPGDFLFFRDGSPASIRTTLTRVRDEFKKERREYTSKKVSHGVNVWRLQ